MAQPVLRTVLLLAHQCAPFNRPDHMIGAQRPAQFAKYLPRYGWRAVVLCHDGREATVAPQEIVSEVERALAAAPPSSSVVIPVPAAPTGGLLDRLVRRTTPRHSDTAARRVLHRLFQEMKRPWGDWTQNWHQTARVAADAVAARVRVDACIGEAGPDAGLYLAPWFARRHGVPWIADFRDPILASYRPRSRHTLRAIVRHLLASAHGTVAVTPYWADLDRETFGLPVWLIPNGFDPEEFAGPEAPLEAPPEAAPSGGALTVGLYGTMLRQTAYETFFEGFAAARRSGADVRFVYRGGHDEFARALAARHGIEDAVDVGGMVERESALRLLESSDVLLVLSRWEDDVYFERGIYPGKGFECMGARRPILCVPGDGAQLDELLARTRTGTVRSTPAEVASYLVEAAERKGSGIPLPYDPDEAEVARYTRAEGARLLAEVLDGLPRRS